ICLSLGNRGPEPVSAFPTQSREADVNEQTKRVGTLAHMQSLPVARSQVGVPLPLTPLGCEASRKAENRRGPFAARQSVNGRRARLYVASNIPRRGGSKAASWTSAY